MQGSDGSLSKVKMPVELGHEIFIDKENILWICSLGSGTFKLANPNLQIDGTLSGPNRENAINDAFFTNDTTWYIINSRTIARQTSSGTQKFTIDIPEGIAGCKELIGRLLISSIQQFYSAAIPSHSSKVITVKKLFSFPAKESHLSIRRNL